MFVEKRYIVIFEVIMHYKEKLYQNKTQGFKKGTDIFTGYNAKYLIFITNINMLF